MHINVNKFPDRETLAAALAERIGGQLTAGIREHQQASLAVSGGSTPVLLFERLSELEIPWRDVVVTLVDERWVAPGANDSNEQLVRSHLLKNKAAAATFIGMKNAAASAGAGEVECAQQLQKVPRPFEVLILGMGLDGHTASLFAGAEELAAATDMASGKTCMAITAPTAPHERMTLTLPALLASRQIFLHITGQEKNEVLQKALAGGPAEKMPIRFFLRRQKPPLSIYWAP